MIGAIYVITDPASHLSILDQARAAAKGGAWAVQLRHKTASDADMLDLALKLRPELSTRGVKLIINDRVDVALRADADGIHIGQGDGDPNDVRGQVGPAMVLGLSVETFAQARLVPPCVNYIGAGPVRATPTKPDHAVPIGLTGLAEIASAVSVPTIAIGGLDLDDVALIKATGAQGMALVSAVSRASDPLAVIKSLMSDWATA